MRTPPGGVGIPNFFTGANIWIDRKVRASCLPAMTLPADDFETLRALL